MEDVMKKVLAILFVWMMVPAVGFADDLSCTSDSDCPDDFYCIAPLCACASPDGEEVPDCFCGTGYCVEDQGGGGYVDDIYFESECVVDADCPADFRCEEISWACASPACPPCACAGCDPDSEDCENPEPCECPPCEYDYECEGGSTFMCVYTPVECDKDLDCPTGFECEVYTWGVSGGGATECVCAPCPEGSECPECDCGGDIPVSSEDDPDTYEFEEFGFCVPKKVACDTEADCVEGWSCVPFPGACMCTDCACPACMEGEECPECDCGKEECTCEEGESYCMPAGWGDVMAAAGDMYGGSENDSMALISAPEGAVRKEAAAGGDGDQTGTPKGDDAAEGGGSTGGCSSTGTSAGSTGLFLLMALASLLVLAVRRETVKVR
jgi:MYXO-CTERM domain-containing protein